MSSRDVRPRFGYWESLQRRLQVQCDDDVFDFDDLSPEALSVLDEPYETIALSSTQLARWRRLAIQVYGALLAYEQAQPDGENPPSLDTCDCSPTPEQTGESAANTELLPLQADALDAVFRMGVDDVERAVQIVSQPRPAQSAIYTALQRDDKRRQWKVLSLLERGEVKHADRLASCGRRSTQLQCGLCESEENYVPISCDSRLCPDCNEDKIGRNIEKYASHVKRMQTPVLVTLTVENYEDPVRGREEIMEDLGALRRRTVPLSGSTTRETEDGEIVEKSWCWWEGTDLEDIDEDQEQWKLKLQQQGRHDLVRRLQKEYVNYEYTDITGTHVGRNIPFDELVEGGLYGIDIKQQGPTDYNVHVHCLMDAAYIPQAALSYLWEDITGGSCVVDVRSIYNRDGRDDIEEALSETVGYAVKPPQFESLDAELEFVEAAKGCPTVHPFGSLHGASTSSGNLVCADCDVAPAEWTYLGTVDEPRDTVGKDWETDRGKDPPGD